MTACSRPSQPDEAPARARARAFVPSWVELAIELRSTEPGGDAADLAPLRPSLIDARVVAIGEATHGSREFFGLRERLLAWSIAELGVRALAIESSMAEVAELDRYIQGQGDAAEVETLVARNSNWPWRTVEFARTLAWLRSYNRGRDPSERVHVYGFDIQQPWVTLTVLREALAGAPELASGLERTEVVRVATTPSTYAAFEPDERAETRAALLELDARLRAEPGMDPLLLRTFGTLIQVEAHYGLTEHGGVSPAREQAMADNIRFIAEELHPRGPIMVWAHDGHISRAPLHPSHGDAMGRHLAESFGERFVNVGLAFDHGAFLARDRGAERHPITRFELPSGPEGGLGPRLAAANMPLFALDLRRLPPGDPLRDWLSEPCRTWMAGSVVTDPHKQVGELLLEAFDLLVFVQEVSPTTLVAEAR